MSRSGGLSEARPPVKSPSKLGTHLSTHCRRDERLIRPCPSTGIELGPESLVKWTGIENHVEFLSKEMPDIKIDDDDMFEIERRLNVYLNSNKLEQLENQHAEKLVKYG
ncbi:hypothetical protein TNCV_971751 [Trichonephila clavipes]|nr:hypothetical protein TNCV_971751 [Trichonephila clavipes]